ncbi:DUF5719 family protein [Gulosibacter chungangensis]|uniref:Large extracellular alpha-helical protein n=1 Tax=Gulosibacter chungangensis TaxID=979746 RepID=A0A7J5BET3_9MICO|nr:DUF5719 family protein [Gulosibacter chungangensis]KAB1644735.1 hypothetical protein F8O05_00165 [Gulosibacter chungangensis]
MAEEQNLHDEKRDGTEHTQPKAETVTGVDRELLNPPEHDPYAVLADADADAAADVEADDVASPAEDLPVDESAPSSTASAARVTTAGGSTMARRVRRARRARRGQKAVARRRNIVGAITHTLGALAAVGVVAGTTWALGWVQFPEYHAEAETMEIAPAPGVQQRVCPGALQQLGLASDAEQALPVGSAEVTIASSIDDYSTVELGENDTDPVNVEVPGEVDGESTMLSASQSLAVATSDTMGLSVTTCTQPAATQWLAAGATTLGHTLALDVINPGQSEARVNFEVYGIDGVVVPGLPEVVIEPGSREVMSLAGIAPNATAFAVKVTSTGAPVSAFLHETITDTLTPKGSDLVGATALPSTQQSLPGIFVYGRPDADATTLAEIGTTLRILNPNDEIVTGTLTAYDLNGEAVYSEDLELASYRVVELPFAEVPEGEYTITLDADQPVLMTGRVSPLDGNEFAWIPSSSSLVGDELVPVPEGPSPRLSVFNPTADAREVEVNGATVSIEPLSTYQADVSGGSTVSLGSAEGLTAALHYAAAGELASAPVRPGNADAEPIRIVK